ncbi:hypothetical protein [Streptomyces sp. NPDC102370]|uniref:hypothetical protein n=1 Tax=Streptomyces sp. NPDC102370 TaxID=3366163 RepID=UPI0037F17B61
MQTYTTGRSRTGHYKQPGSHLTYCGRTAGTAGTADRICRPCVKAEARDRAEATAVAESHLITNPTEWERDLLASDAVRDAIAAEQAETVTPGTWRAEWISARAASPAPTLFDVEPEAEQGALFA